MKQITGIGLLIVTAIVVVLLFWGHIKIARDRHFSQLLAGEWSSEFANIRETIDYKADGGIIGQVVLTYSTHTNTYQMTGTWRINDSRIITTITNDSYKKHRVPRTGVAEIVRIDHYECVVDEGENTMVLKRVAP
jgi:hypothetical protein